MSDSVKFSLVGASGVIHLREDAADYIRTSGGSGWGMAPVANQWFQGAGPGARFRGARRVARTLSLPVVVFAEGPREVESRLRRLARTVHDPILIRATYPDGAVFTIPAVYESGAEGSYGSDGGERHARWAFVFKCGDPYWTSESVQTTEWSDSSQVPFLDTLTLSASTLSGVREVVNTGDVESRAAWVIRGPFASVSAEVGGVGFEFTDPMGAGEFLSIRWENDGWMVTDQDGVNRYDGFASTPRFPVFAPGVSQVTVDVLDAATGTRVSLFWPARVEVVY